MTALLRPVEARDFEAIVALSQRLYEEHPGPLPMDAAKVHATLAALAADARRGRTIVAELDHRVAGFALVAEYWSNEYGGLTWILDELSVAPDARGQGLGQALVERVESDAKAAGIRAIVLELDDGNVAGRLYARLGFGPTRRQLLRKVL